MVLEQKIAPYAELAAEMIRRPLGTAEGEWDLSSDYFARQTDTTDFIGAATMAMATERLRAMYSDPGQTGVEGLDHLDVDMVMSSVVTSGRYVIRPGSLSMRDMYLLYRYANNILVIPMRGSEIRAVMEENAANRLSARVLNGETYIFNVRDDHTHMIFTGINFVYDLSAPEGERVRIEGFADGRPFEDEGVYLAAVNNYLLGNERCGLRIFSADDAVWAQPEDETVQDLLADYVKAQCEANGVLTTAPFTWHWSIEFGADPAEATAYDGPVAARLVSAPEDGHRYVIMQEGERMALSGSSEGSGLEGVPCTAWGNILAAPLDPEAQRFTVRLQEDGSMALVNDDGLYLTGAANGGGLSLTPEMAEDGLSLWTLREANGGWNILCVGTAKSGNYPKALEFYNEIITTYGVGSGGIYVFNFYEIQNE